MPEAIAIYQYKIKKDCNSFLKWDSWVNCTALFCANPQNLNTQTFLGVLDHESLYHIIGAILDKNNKAISEKQRKSTTLLYRKMILFKEIFIMEDEYLLRQKASKKNTELPLIESKHKRLKR